MSKRKIQKIREDLDKVKTKTREALGILGHHLTPEPSPKRKHTPVQEDRRHE